MFSITSSVVSDFSMPRDGNDSHNSSLEFRQAHRLISKEWIRRLLSNINSKNI